MTFTFEFLIQLLGSMTFTAILFAIVEAIDRPSKRRRKK